MKKKFDILSLGLALVVNALILLLLFLLGLELPERQSESGVPVMIGNMGNLDTDYELTEVASMPVPPPAVDEVQPQPDQADVNLTQELEQTVALDNGKKDEKPAVKPVQPVKPVETVRQPTPEELKAQEEQRLREQAQAIDNALANAFANSGNLQSSDEGEKTDAVGIPGSVTGNSDQGKTSGTGSYGTYDLGGRGINGALPKPSTNDIHEEGVVVVTITVSPDGKVVDTSINKRTNTASQKLRSAAMEAARRARFDAIPGPDTQSGTITYYFRY